MLLWTKSLFSPTQIITPVNFKGQTIKQIIVVSVGLNIQCFSFFSLLYFLCNKSLSATKKHLSQIN